MSKYTIEKHGDGYAIYFGRDWQHHGANIGHLTEVTPATIKLIQDALNATLAQPEQAHTDHPMRHWDRTCPACVSEPWDTNDMAHRPSGLAVDDDDIQEYKKPWIGLSDTEAAIYGNQFSGTRLVKAIEALLRERNT